MAIDTCPTHKVICTKRCPVCFRHLCSQCPTIDGCCTRACYGRRLKHGGPVHRAPRGSQAWSVLGALIKLAMLAAVGYAVARYLGKV